MQYLSHWGDQLFPVHHLAPFFNDKSIIVFLYTFITSLILLWWVFWPGEVAFQFLIELCLALIQPFQRKLEFPCWFLSVSSIKVRRQVTTVFFFVSIIPITFPLSLSFIARAGSCNHFDACLLECVIHPTKQCVAYYCHQISTYIAQPIKAASFVYKVDFEWATPNFSEFMVPFGEFFPVRPKSVLLPKRYCITRAGCVFLLHISFSHPCIFMTSRTKNCGAVFFLRFLDFCRKCFFFMSQIAICLI